MQFTFAFTPIVQQAFTDVLVDWKNYFRSTWVIMLMVFVCMVIPVGLSGARNAMGFVYPIMGLVLSLAQLVIMACFISGWYQQTLLGQNKDQIIMVRLGDAERAMILTYAKMFAITGLPLIVVMLIVQKIMPGMLSALIGFVLFLAAFYVSCRFSLAAPLTTKGDAAPLQSSWDMTANDIPSIAGGAALAAIGFYVPFMIAIVIISFVVGLLLPGILVDAVGTALKAAGFVVFFGIAANYNALVLAELKNPTPREAT